MIDDVTRVGIMVKRRGTWRDTVAFYGAHRDLAAQCLARFDALVDAGMPDSWAALRALDDHACADLIVSNESINLTSRTRIN